MTFAFTPADGYRNTTSYPTNPASETAFRDSMMDLLDQIRDELNSGSSSAIGIQALNRQAIMNGNFDVFQRGATVTNPGSGTYVADRFQTLVSLDGGVAPVTTTHERLALTPGDIPGSFYYYRVSVDGAGSAYGSGAEIGMFQRIENATRFLAGAGKKVTLSFWARSSISSKRVGVVIKQRYGTGGSPSSENILTGQILSLTSSWQKFTVTFDAATLVGKTFGTNNDDYFQLGFYHVWGTTTATNYFGGGTAETFGAAGTIDIAQAGQNAGAVALPFQPRSIDEETKRCIRYVWIPQTNSVYARASTYTANTIVFDVSLPVQLRSTPTIRGTVNTDLVVNTVAGAAQSGFTAAATLTSSGIRLTLTKVAHGLTDAYLEIKTTSGFDSEL